MQQQPLQNQLNWSQYCTHEHVYYIGDPLPVWVLLNRKTTTAISCCNSLVNVEYSGSKYNCTQAMCVLCVCLGGGGGGGGGGKGKVDG